MGRLSFDFQVPRGRSDAADPGLSRVLVIGDLSGSGTHDLAAAQLVRIDVTNFDAVVRSLQPTAVVPSASTNLPDQRLTFVSLEDFHPDRLFETLDGVLALRRARERCADSLSASEPAREPLLEPPPSDAAPVEDDASTLERLLGARPARMPSAAAPSPAAAANAPFDQMLRNLVAPHLVRGPGAEAQQRLAAADAAIGDELRRVLHSPSFQRLEAIWRGLRNLVFENPIGAELEVYVLDASRADLVADLRACGGDIERSNLHRLLVRPAEGLDGSAFSLVIADLSVSGEDEDVSLLAGLGAAAGQAGGCVIAGADPMLWGASDASPQPERRSLPPDEALRARLAMLRSSAVAPFIGLCAPRVLGRLPYGPKTDPIESFEFSELGIDPGHHEFLWVNAAFACAQVILAGVAEDGWDAGPGKVLDLGALPHVMLRTGAQPCAELFLDESTANAILTHGVMPFMSYRNRNAVRLLRLQSIARPASRLALRSH